RDLIVTGVQTCALPILERTREIGVRKALGATTTTIQRQFFLEGFFLTLLSGGAGMMIALGLCRLVNMAPMPERFSGMILSWQSEIGRACVGKEWKTWLA